MKWGLFILMASLTEGWAEEGKVGGARNVELIYEAFSLPLAEAAQMRRVARTDGELYQSLVDRLDRGEVKQESFLAVTGRSGEELILVDVEGVIYPTEWEPPEGFANPSNLLVYEKGFTPLAPSAFDTKNIGSTLFVTPKFEAGVDLVELEVSMSRTRWEGLERWGMAPVDLPMPKFGVAGIDTKLVVRSGEVSLLGTMNEEERRVGFAFLRARVDELDLERGEFRAAKVRYEVFSLSIDEAAAMRRVRGDQKSLYDRVVEGMPKQRVKQEKLICVQSVPGVSAALEQVVELIYPSEYNPPGFSYELMVIEEENRPKTRRFPKVTSAFDTKNLGDMIEMEMQWDDERGAEIRLVESHVALLKRNAFGEGMARSEMPEFTVQALRTAAILSAGVSTLVGTVTPASEEGQIWWAFVTVSPGE